MCGWRCLLWGFLKSSPEEQMRLKEKAPKGTAGTQPELKDLWDKLCPAKGCGALGTFTWHIAGCTEVPEWGLGRGPPHLHGARLTWLRAFWTGLAAVQAGQSSAQKSCDSSGPIGLYRNKQCLHLLYFSCVLLLLGLRGQEFLHSLLTGEMVKGTPLSPVSPLY